mmetsp:Transcript_44654/g.97235  ORF Transcript_44654/g.97235 Transcript_44654/m.97235 type:complete len:548 (+) Transcript_44654:114-1757(+)
MFGEHKQNSRALLARRVFNRAGSRYVTCTLKPGLPTRWHCLQRLIVGGLGDEGAQHGVNVGGLALALDQLGGRDALGARLGLLAAHGPRRVEILTARVGHREIVEPHGEWALLRVGEALCGCGEDGREGAGDAKWRGDTLEITRQAEGDAVGSARVALRAGQRHGVQVDEPQVARGEREHKRLRLLRAQPDCVAEQRVQAELRGELPMHVPSLHGLRQMALDRLGQNVVGNRPARVVVGLSQPLAPRLVVKRWQHAARECALVREHGAVRRVAAVDARGDEHRRERQVRLVAHMHGDALAQPHHGSREEVEPAPPRLPRLEQTAVEQPQQLRRPLEPEAHPRREARIGREVEATPRAVVAKHVKRASRDARRRISANEHVGGEALEQHVRLHHRLVVVRVLAGHLDQRLLRKDEVSASAVERRHRLALQRRLHLRLKSLTPAVQLRDHLGEHRRRLADKVLEELLPMRRMKRRQSLGRVIAQTGAHRESGVDGLQHRRHFLRQRVWRRRRHREADGAQLADGRQKVLEHRRLELRLHAVKHHTQLRV